MNHYDVILIGGGPACLTAAAILEQKQINYLIIEKGQLYHRRSSKNPKEIASGIGGGGLFSDGKLSFYPSGSELYKLKEELLLKSWQELTSVCNNIGVEIPIFDRTWSIKNNTPQAPQSSQKLYESIKLSNYELFQLAAELNGQIPPHKIKVNSTVTEILAVSDSYRITILSEGKSQYVTCDTLVIGTGKIANPKDLFKNILLKTKFQKIELGIRVQMHNINALDHYEQKDLKLIYPIDEGVSARTFCFCRDGYVINSQWEDEHFWNGVSEANQTDMTNFGINIRFDNEKVYNKYSEQLALLRKNKKYYFESEISQFLSNAQNWPFEIHSLFTNLINDKFDFIKDDKVTVSGPSWEYRGNYPVLNNELRHEPHRIWFVGDTTGLFRGLVPALISGYVAGHSIPSSIQHKMATRMAELKLPNRNFGKHKKIIFTAQSKYYFFCKEAVCEYVLKAGHIPLNPFQVFGYFLSDRIERDEIRLGNDNLIFRSDELWIFGPVSNGVLYEINLAYSLGIPIRYFSIGSTIQEIDDISFPQIQLEHDTVENETHRRYIYSLIQKTLNRNPSDL